MDITPCVNLRQEYGKRYKIGREAPANSWTDPWYHVLLCRYGHIYPHSATELAFTSNRRLKATRKLAATISGARILTFGDDGVTVAFPAEQLETVLELVKPYRRRRLSEAYKAVLVARMKKLHEGKQKTGKNSQ